MWCRLVSKVRRLEVHATSKSWRVLTSPLGQWPKKKKDLSGELTWNISEPSIKRRREVSPRQESEELGKLLKREHMDRDREHVIRHYPSQTGPLVRNDNYNFITLLFFSFFLFFHDLWDSTCCARDAFLLRTVVKSGYIRAEHFPSTRTSPFLSDLSNQLSFQSREITLAGCFFPLKCVKITDFWNTCTWHQRPCRLPHGCSLSHLFSYFVFGYWPSDTVHVKSML